jgi:hypothetical protein
VSALLSNQRKQLILKFTVTIDDATQKSKCSSSALSVHQDNQLSFRVKSEPANDLTSFDTLSFGSGYSLDFSPSPTFPPSSDLYQGQSIVDQMKSIVATSQGTTLESHLRSKVVSPLSSDNILNSESEQSPCPVRNKATISASSTEKSRSFRNRRVKKYTKAEILRPGWINTLGSGKNTSGASRQAKTKNLLSLEHLQDIERGPKHTWTTNERITLLSLRRWYILQRSEFRDLFNSLTGLTMKHNTLATQFANGGTPFNKVRCPFYSVPFDDPDNVYENIRGYIENRASDLGIELRYRKEPEPHEYEQDGLRVTGWTTDSNELLPRVQPHLRQSPAQNSAQKPLGGYAILDRDPNDDDEFFNIEVAPIPSSSAELQYFSRPFATSCHLAFRYAKLSFVSRSHN